MSYEQIEDLANAIESSLRDSDVAHLSPGDGHKLRGTFASVLEERAGLRAERDALLWALAAVQYRIVNWCEHADHVPNCECDGSWLCCERSEFRPALVKVDANAADRFVSWLPTPAALREFGARMQQWSYKPLPAAVTPTEEQIQAFKEAWHAADVQGREGERVRDGLSAVLALVVSGQTPQEPMGG